MKITPGIAYIFIDYYSAIALEHFLLLIWPRNEIFLIANVLTSCDLEVAFLFLLGNFCMPEISHWLLTFHS